MLPPTSEVGAFSVPLSPEARLLGLCARISTVQRHTLKLAGLELQAELLGERDAADHLHRRQVRLVQFRHRLIAELCEIPAISAEACRAKAFALFTLVTLGPQGRPEQPEELALWSVCRDLAAAADAQLFGGERFPPEAFRTALHLVWRAAWQWGLDEVQTRRLLGSPAEETLQGWFRGPAPRGAPGTRRRIGLVIALHRRLRRRYAWPDRGFDWMTRSNLRLGGRSPLARMLDGGVDDLLAVHSVLDGEENADGLEPPGKRLRPASGLLEADLEAALAAFCDREREVRVPAGKREAASPFSFPSWDAVERWVWTSDGNDDAPVRMRIARLLVLARRVIGDEDALRRWLTARQVWIGNRSPLAAATTPGGLHRAEGLLRIVEEQRRRLRGSSIPPDDK
ncbi:antitoxin Xre/MbcA/ParS toxin-binding domain-containing protein [Roseomonas sp. WA12]